MRHESKKNEKEKKNTHRGEWVGDAGEVLRQVGSLTGDAQQRCSIVSPCHIRVPEPVPAYAYLSEGSSMPQLGRLRGCPADGGDIADPFVGIIERSCVSERCVEENELVRDCILVLELCVSLPVI